MERDRPILVLPPTPTPTPAGGADAVETETEAETKAEAEAERGKEREKEKGKTQVRFQWDPERDVKLQRLPYRSLQVGIAGEMVRRWIDEWIVRIEDVTEDVRRFHALIENEKGGGDHQVGGAAKVIEELRGEKWREDVLHLGEELEMVLGMPGNVAS